jgi:hypothetical protein
MEINRNNFNVWMDNFNKNNNNNVDYAIRNCTVGDEEQIRLWENPEDYVDNVPIEVRDQLRKLIVELEAEKDGVEENIIELLMPYMSNRDVYEFDYPLWETLFWTHRTEKTYDEFVTEWAERND